jgi:hypothetical protein
MERNGTTLPFLHSGETAITKITCNFNFNYELYNNFTFVPIVLKSGTMVGEGILFSKSKRVAESPGESAPS